MCWSEAASRGSRSWGFDAPYHYLSRYRSTRPYACAVGDVSDASGPDSATSASPAELESETERTEGAQAETSAGTDFGIAFVAAVEPIETRFEEVQAEMRPLSEQMRAAYEAGDVQAFDLVSMRLEPFTYRLATLWGEYADAVQRLDPPAELAVDVDRVIQASREAARSMSAMDESAQQRVIVSTDI